MLGAASGLYFLRCNYLVSYFGTPRDYILQLQPECLKENKHTKRSQLRLFFHDLHDRSRLFDTKRDIEAIEFRF
jgi:hypothetical protein